MAFQSLRSFLEELKKCGQLAEIDEEVNPEPDIRTYLRAAADYGDSGPAVVFNSIVGYRGLRVAGNVHGSWANHAILLGMDKDAGIRDQFFEIDRLWGDKYGTLRYVENPPCQEVIVDRDINLYALLPLFRINQQDGGFYFSKASVVSRDPDDPDNDDKENVGMYRIQVQGPDTLGIQIGGTHDLAAHIKRAEPYGRPVPVAICLGNPPLLSSLAATPLPYDQSEYKVASAIMGEPFQVTKAIGSNLNVPAGTEYILEGEVVPRVRVCEGPFGEMPGSYSGARMQYKIKIRRVTHRKDPIFENLFIGLPWTEHDTLVGLWTCVPLYKQLKHDFPEVKCVNALYQHGTTIIISSDSRFGGFGKTLAFRMATTTHGMSYGKIIIVVDGDVDPFNLTQVMWSLSMRVRLQKDLVVIPNTLASPLDPSADFGGMSSKLIIDATTPVFPDKMEEITMVTRPPKTDEFAKKLDLIWKSQK
jgi:UbiD family decarboxylase